MTDYLEVMKQIPPQEGYTAVIVFPPPKKRRPPVKITALTLECKNPKTGEVEDFVTTYWKNEREGRRWCEEIRDRFDGDKGINFLSGLRVQYIYTHD